MSKLRELIVREGLDLEKIEGMSCVDRGQLCFFVDVWIFLNKTFEMFVYIFVYRS